MIEGSEIKEMTVNAFDKDDPSKPLYYVLRLILKDTDKFITIRYLSDEDRQKALKDFNEGMKTGDVFQLMNKDKEELFVFKIEKIMKWEEEKEND